MGIIIPFFNGEKYLLKCVTSILEDCSDEDQVEVFIVDNDRNRGRQVLATVRTWPGVRVIETVPALGFGRACNAGAEVAINDGCEYLIFLNQDTIIKKGTISCFESALSEHSSREVFTPMIYEYDFSQLMLLTIAAYLTQNVEYFSDTFHGKMKKKYELPTVGAVCIALHSDLIDKIGLFDPVFYMYGEDFDFFKRLNVYGGKLFLLTEPAVSHIGGLNELNGPIRQFGSLHYMQAQVVKALRYENHARALKKLLFYLRINIFYLGSKSTLKYIRLIWSVGKNYFAIRDHSISGVKNRIGYYLRRDSQLTKKQ